MPISVYAPKSKGARCYEKLTNEILKGKKHNQEVYKMTKMSGLGKGLDALLLNNVVEEEKVREGEMVENLKLIDVEPNREQPGKKSKFNIFQR